MEPGPHRGQRAATDGAAAIEDVATKLASTSTLLTPMPPEVSSFPYGDDDDLTIAEFSLFAVEEPEPSLLELPEPSLPEAPRRRTAQTAVGTVPPPLDSTLERDRPSWLIVTSGHDLGRIFELPHGNSISIGRGVDNTVVLTDLAVSRHHLLLDWIGENWQLVDRGSGNGTFVNEQPAAKDEPLRHGDRLELGTTQLRFENPPLPTGTSAPHSHLVPPLVPHSPSAGSYPARWVVSTTAAGELSTHTGLIRTADPHRAFVYSQPTPGTFVARHRHLIIRATVALAIGLLGVAIMSSSHGPRPVPPMTATVPPLPMTATVPPLPAPALGSPDAPAIPRGDSAPLPLEPPWYERAYRYIYPSPTGEPSRQ